MAAIYRPALSLSLASITRRKLRMKWRLRAGAAEGRGHCRTYGRSQFMLDPRDRSPELRQSACPTSPMFNLLTPFIRIVFHMIKHSSFPWELGSGGMALVFVFRQHYRCVDWICFQSESSRTVGYVCLTPVTDACVSISSSSFRSTLLLHSDALEFYACG